MSKLFTATDEETGITYAWTYVRGNILKRMGKGKKMDLIEKYQKDYIIVDGDTAETVKVFPFQATSPDGHVTQRKVVSSATSMSDLLTDCQDVLMAELNLTPEQVEDFEIELF